MYFGCGLMVTQMVCEVQDAYQKECLNKWEVMQGHKAFLEGCESTEKLNSFGSPFTSIMKENINTVATTIRKDRHLSIRDLSAQINIPKTILLF